MLAWAAAVPIWATKRWRSASNRWLDGWAVLPQQALAGLHCARLHVCDAASNAVRLSLQPLSARPAGWPGPRPRPHLR